MEIPSMVFTTCIWGILLKPPWPLTCFNFIDNSILMECGRAVARNSECNLKVERKDQILHTIDGNTVTKIEKVHK